MRVLLVIFIAALFGSSAGAQTAGGWQAGTHYQVLAPEQAVQFAGDKVKVQEFFGYKCPHCNALEPYLVQLKKQMGERIEFSPVPVAWQPEWREYARLYFVLQGLGRDSLHQEVFDTVHVRKSKLASKDPEESFQLQLAFATAHGIAEKDFVALYRSPKIEQQLQTAMDTAVGYKVVGVPTLVVAGKYVTNTQMAGGAQQLMELVDHLVAAESRRATRMEQTARKPP